jgi:hypothetical protein
MQKWRLFLVFVMFGLLYFSVQADQWWTRGDPGTTWQEWGFGTPDNPVVPDVFDNPGNPLAEVTPIGDIHGYAAGWYDSFLGREGVWHGERILLDLTIPNFLNPNEFKEIWVQIGFRSEFLPDMTIVTSDPQGVVEPLGYSVTPESLNQNDMGWSKLLIGWKIIPNPDIEWIHLEFLNSGAELDYVIADTICTPEPMTCILLAFGSLAVLRKRK